MLGLLTLINKKGGDNISIKDWVTKSFDKGAEGEQDVKTEEGKQVTQEIVASNANDFQCQQPIIQHCTKDQTRAEEQSKLSQNINQIEDRRNDK